MKLTKCAVVAVTALFLATVIVVPTGYADTVTAENPIDTYIYGLTYDEDADIVMNTGTAVQKPTEWEGDDVETVTTKYVLKTTDNDPSAVMGNNSSIESKTYPGAMLQGNKNLANNTPDQVITASRSDTGYTINLPMGDKYSTGFTANPQNYSTVQDAINAKLEEWKRTHNTVASTYSYEYTEAHTSEQVQIDLGITAEQLAGLGLSPGWSEDGESTTYIVEFTQIYYTVSITPFAKASEYFGRTQTADALKPYIFNHNMGVVVNTASYGAQVFAKITSESNTEEASLALSLVICGNEESLTTTQQEIVENSTFMCYVYGGNYSDTPQSIEEVKEMLSDTSITADNITTAKPIQYTTAFITDGSEASCQANTYYNEAETVITQQITYSYEFGGGYVGQIKMSYETYDSMEDGEYVGLRTVTLDYQDLLCGYNHSEMLTAKHTPTFVIEMIGGDGCPTALSNYSVYPLYSLHINEYGHFWNVDYQVHVDGTCVISG